MDTTDFISRFGLAEKLEVTPAQLESLLDGLELVYGLHFGVNSVGGCLFNSPAVVIQVKMLRSQALKQAQAVNKHRMDLLRIKYGDNFYQIK